MAERLEPESQSLFQPFLAGYGGIISFILGTVSEITRVDFPGVIFHGFQTWKWDSMADQCAMASWAVIAAFLLIIASLSFTTGTSPFARYDVPISTKTDGKAPPLDDPVIIRSRWKRAWEAFLNAL